MSRKPTMCGRNQTHLPDGACDDCTQLDQRITALENCCDEMRSWKTTIDSWKTTITNWKSGIDTWRDTVDSTLGSLQTQITSLNNWKTTINNWKNTIDTWKEGLATDLTAIRNRLTAIEAWESTINSWKNGIDTWKTNVDTWKSNFDTWKSNIDTNGYNVLANKPTINGVTVQGNKSSEDYLITAISQADIITLTPMDCYDPPCSDSRACYGEACCMIVGCSQVE